jgi:hypothetical protein
MKLIQMKEKRNKIKMKKKLLGNVYGSESTCIPNLLKIKYVIFHSFDISKVERQSSKLTNVNNMLTNKKHLKIRKHK